MRQHILDKIGEKPALHHFGYAYELLAPPPGGDGKVDPKRRDSWLDRCDSMTVDPEYQRFYDLWKRDFQAGCTRTIKAKSRLLVGHGNPSGADVGLTVHHTWGVPVIPGSALKGVLAHYIRCGLRRQG